MKTIKEIIMTLIIIFVVVMSALQINGNLDEKNDTVLIELNSINEKLDALEKERQDKPSMLKEKIKELEKMLKDLVN